jgi:hypothetical protein
MDITFTAQPAPSVPDARGLVAPLHLLHRPVTPEGFLLDAAAPVEQHFALSAELPQEHGTFTDGPGTFHDLLYIAETLRQAAHFVAHQYFRVPAERPLRPAGPSDAGPHRVARGRGQRRPARPRLPQRRGDRRRPLWERFRTAAVPDAGGVPVAP